MNAMPIFNTSKRETVKLTTDSKTKRLLIEYRYMCPTCERLLAAGAACPMGHPLAIRS